MAEAYGLVVQCLGVKLIRVVMVNIGRRLDRFKNHLGDSFSGYACEKLFDLGHLKQDDSESGLPAFPGLESLTARKGERKQSTDIHLHPLAKCRCSVTDCLKLCCSDLPAMMDFSFKL